MNPEKKPISKLRLAVFLLILAFMVLGPFYRQVLGGKNLLFRQWVMFRGKGVGVIDASFYQVFPDGSRKEINRYEVLGYSSPRDAPRYLWRIRGRSGTLNVTKRLCQKLGPGADVRVISRWASRKGWRQGFPGKQNLCPKLVRTPKPQRKVVP